MQIAFFSSVKIWDLRVRDVVKSMGDDMKGPKICGDAIAVRGDYCVTGSLLPQNSIDLWSIKVRDRSMFIGVKMILNDKEVEGYRFRQRSRGLQISRKK